ncbi:MAG: MOSC N-terminal beta barrel domain-containing protein, partial [Thermoanaerobaculia bacterium]
MPHVSALYVYPIKSCRGTALQSAAVGRRGILHDREFMIVDGDGLMLTQRAYPRMVFVAPSITGEELAIDIPGYGATTVSLRGFSD